MDGPVNEVQVEVGRVEQLERLVDSSEDVIVLGAPQLGRDEDVLASNAARLDALADLSLVAVDPGATARHVG